MSKVTVVSGATTCLPCDPTSQCRLSTGSEIAAIDGASVRLEGQ